MTSAFKDKNIFSALTLDVHQVAAFLGWTEKRVRGHIARQTLPYRKQGGRILFLRSELERFIDNLPGTTLETAMKNVERRQIL